MGNVYRIAFVKMLVLLRLAIIASLALYTLPSASYAMHGDIAASYELASLAAQDDHGHVHAGSQTASDKHDHRLAHDLSKNPQKPAVQDCCSDFCISLAIIGNAPGFWRALQPSIRDFRDDRSVFGQLTTLHRPPSTAA